MRATFAARGKALEQIRTGVLLSGTLARDYFLAPNDPGAPVLQARLHQLEQETNSAIARWGEAAADLRGEVTTYWRLLDLMADLASSRRTAGLDEYFRRQLAQRRETMLAIAGEIGARMEAERKRSESEIEDSARRFRVALGLELVLVVGAGMTVSVATARRLIRLEADARGLSAQLVRTQEQERRAIARELHDEVGQAISGMLIDVGHAARAAESEGQRSRLQAIAERAERAVEDVRRMALSLRPSMLDDLGLVAALEWQAREVGHRTGLNVRVEAEDIAGELPEAHRTCIYRVAQEALRNCARHAGARCVRIGLEREGARVALRVEDDGRGFAVARSRGLGLLGMEERVAQLGGRLRVQSEPGRGTTVTAELPV
jgi:signal transduction histidine kinase